MSMEPSKEAIEAAKATVWTTQLGYQDSLIKDSKRYVLDVESALKAAFAIDFSAHQQAMQGLQAQLDAKDHRIAALEEAACEECNGMQALQVRVSELEAQVEVGLQISGSFFEALKPLKLKQININNPGAHVTELIQQLAYRKGEIERRDEFLERRGYRRCDIAACNCESWHGGHEQQRADRLKACLDIKRVKIGRCSWCSQGFDYDVLGDEAGKAALMEHARNCKGHPAVQQLAEQRAEVERLKAISLCRCGDGFSLTDPGTCGNCLATYYTVPRTSGLRG